MCHFSNVLEQGHSLSALTDCILVAILNSIQSFSFLTPAISIIFCLFVSAVLAKGKITLRAAACIIALFVILAIGYIWMILVCILRGGSFEDAFWDFMTPGPLRCIYLTLDKTTDIAIYLIFRKRLHRLSTLKNRWLVSLLIGSAFAYVVAQYLMNAILSHDVYTMHQVSIVSFLVLLLFFLVFSLLLLTISSRDHERAQRLVLQQTDRLMEKNYQMLHWDLLNRPEIRKLRNMSTPSWTFLIGTFGCAAAETTSLTLLSTAPQRRRPAHKSTSITMWSFLPAFSRSLP